MRMWLNSLDAIHTSLLYGAIKKKKNLLTITHERRGTDGGMQW